MARQVLNSRRPSETFAVPVQMDFVEVKVLVTVGFDAAGNPMEVFCASFKAGTSLHAIVMDACILLSRLLQHGDGPSAVLRGMCQPYSLVGRIAEEVARYEMPKAPDEAEPQPVDPVPPTRWDNSGLAASHRPLFESLDKFD